MTRHYSLIDYKDGRRHNLNNGHRRLIAGPGEKLLLMTVDCKALFIWRKFIDKSGQSGINCSAFRNESSVLSSKLILEAEKLAWEKWPGERLYTYVNAGKVRTGHPQSGKANPGKCFIKAGWKRCGITAVNKLIILEKLPGW